MRINCLLAFKKLSIGEAVRRRSFSVRQSLCHFSEIQLKPLLFGTGNIAVYLSQQVRMLYRDLPYYYTNTVIQLFFAIYQWRGGHWGIYCYCEGYVRKEASQTSREFIIFSTINLCVEDFERTRSLSMKMECISLPYTESWRGLINDLNRQEDNS